MLPAMPRLLDALAFSTGHPDPRLPHPAAQRLPPNVEIMTLCQLLGCECRTKVCVKLPHQSNRIIANYIRQAVVRGDARGAGWRWLKRRHRDIFSTADTFAAALSSSAQQLLEPLICRCLAVPEHQDGSARACSSPPCPSK